MTPSAPRIEQAMLRQACRWKRPMGFLRSIV